MCTSFLCVSGLTSPSTFFAVWWVTTSTMTSSTAWTSPTSTTRYVVTLSSSVLQYLLLCCWFLSSFPYNKVCVCVGGRGGGGYTGITLSWPSVCPGFLQRNLPCRSAFCYQAWHDGGTGTLFSWHWCWCRSLTVRVYVCVCCVCACVCVCVWCVCCVCGVCVSRVVVQRRTWRESMSKHIWNAVGKWMHTCT